MEKELDNVILPTGMANLSRIVPQMTESQKSFVIQHLMRKYIRDPMTFDMEFEAAYLFKGFQEGNIPGGRNAAGEFKHDWHVVRSMAEAGYWMANAGEEIISITWNNEVQKLTSKEILEALSAQVEGSQMSASKTTVSRLLNSILRLAGFETKIGYRKGEAGSKRLWITKNKEDKLADCIERYREAFNSHVDIWS